LTGVDLEVNAGRVTCILGDNGAGKSTLIKILAGLHRPTTGSYLVDGEPVEFASPREALDRGIATVYQDLALVPLMPVWRNFFLGSEPRAGFWPFTRLKVAEMCATADAELKKMGIDLPDIDAPGADLSGGQKQVVDFAAPCTSAPGCSSWTSPPPRSASSSPGWCSSTGGPPGRPGWASCSSRTTRTTPTWSATTSRCCAWARWSWTRPAPS